MAPREAARDDRDRPAGALRAIAPEGSVTSRFLGGGLGARPFPDYARLTHREYGHRVGIFRILDVLEQFGVTPTIALDAMTAEFYPWLVRHLQQRGVTFLAHGIAVTRMISSAMTEQEERAYIVDSLDRLEEVLGERPRGWMGPEQGESERTPALLAELGIDHVCDWPNDEQPYPMTVPTGDLLSIPTLHDLDDSYALVHRNLPLSSWQTMLTDAVDQLITDGEDTARVLALTVRPWLTGQPFRIGVLEDLLAHAAATGKVWFATAEEVADAYRDCTTTTTRPSPALTA
ncbi:polysaccharide deacetylase family protein [Serinibacter arcticus]|uniref:polysaccharide deacetylase family protein n=1 Tax=Serinibacter arcticus TaxID=1655435 RepID=UPI0013049DFE|nr:polysaccharide deacetylase family protein [Serinibacter arcticus]